MSEHRRDTYFQDLFWAHLAGLRTAAGEPHEKELIYAASKKGVTIADATLNDWFKRKSVPGPRTLKQFTALVEALRDRARIRHGPRYEQHNVDFEQLREDAYKERLRRSKDEDQAGATQAAISAGIGRPVEGITDPFGLEVHRPIDIPDAEDLDPLPAYVERRHDEDLRKVVRDAVKGESGIAVLIGTSSSGKTRACWEQLQTLPPGWRLWRPSEPFTAWKQLDDVTGRTVIWLDDTHDSFLVTPESGEALARGLSDLLHDTGRAPVLVLSTMWPDTWDALTTQSPRGTDDPHKRARTLLTGRGIPVPHAFDNERDLAELRAKAAEDPRLAWALAEAEDGEITQFLAGVPVLLERYHTAADGAKALIWAAMDARRLGHSRALPLPFLHAAAPGYLTASQWNRLACQRSWLEKALRYVEADCRGARGPLTPIHVLPGDPQPAEPPYRLADALEQHARSTRRLKVPPASFWDAAARHVTATDDLVALAEAAKNRLRKRHAAQLYERADDARSLRALARIHQEAGHPREAERLARNALDLFGQTNALTDVAFVREFADPHDLEGAERLYREAANAGSVYGKRSLARVLAQSGSPDAERLAREAGTQTTLALRDLARFRWRAGEPEQAERLFQEAAAAGDASALAELSEMRGHRHQGPKRSFTSSLLAAQIRVGRKVTTDPALVERALVEDWEAAERLAEEASHAEALFAIGSTHEDAERPADAERLYQKSVDAGSTTALRSLARLREAAGDQPEAERLARLATDSGSWGALKDLAKKQPKWKQVLMYGLEPDGRPSEPW